MSQLRWLVLKDLWRFLSDRNGAIVTIAMPVVLAALLGMLFSPSDGAGVIDILVVDQDQTDASRALVEAMGNSESLRVTAAELDDATGRLERGDASVVVVLPKGLAGAMTPTALFGGARTTAQILYDPSDKTEAEIAEGLLYRISMEQVAQTLADPTAVRSMFSDLRLVLGQVDDEPELKAFLSAGVDWADSQLQEPAPSPGQEPQDPADTSASSPLKPPIDFQRTAVTAAGPAAGYNSYAHNFAGMLMMFLLFFAVEAAKELVIERDAGVQVRLMLSPVTRRRIIIGRGISTALIALVISIAVYAAGMGVFGVRVLGSWPGFVLVVGALCTFAGGFALLLAGFGRTERQIASTGGFLVLVLSFAGGAMFPSFLMPDWLQTLSLGLPTFWATHGLAAMTWRGLALSDALLPSAILIASGIACGALGAKRYRWCV